MRLELAGSMTVASPLVFTFIDSQTFDTTEYIDAGYKSFEVVCIGGGGGRGGGIDTVNTGTLVKSFGGEGGGGGTHRVRGVLAELPAAVSVIVGAAGAAGADHSFDPASTTHGGDGGASSFNGITCRASGGMGGRRVQSNSTSTTTDADGGDGGIGGTTTAGGGASGGLAGVPTPTGPGTLGSSGVDGTWDGTIGEGGGGGAGGVGKYGGAGTTLNPATAGGRGAYNVSDLSFYSVAGTPSEDPITGSDDVVPGSGGGAKPAPLNGISDIYGQSGQPGVVVIRLTAV